MLIGGPDLEAPELVFETEELLLEAPNWSPDGAGLLLNGDGLLHLLDLADPTRLGPVEFRNIPPINNDHVVHPDGRHILLSADDGHIHHGALTGGDTTIVTLDDGMSHFLHGVSPDGGRIAYVELGPDGPPGRLMVMPLSGERAPSPLDTGPGHVDGPEWSPDGDWILCTTEAFAETSGHAQLARLPEAGGALERLRTSPTVDWFPHPAPDAVHGSFLAYPPGTQGHPGDVDVVVHVVRTADWDESVQQYPVFGGQGTLNVNSWSPDSTRCAFVAHPFDA
ncbi:PD40 domain-containing protein [Nesterenkonia sp. F]|uniref:TolB family protein n=1 Tax=Nesterenkonia sp. F TaxID=795955 RepID=UPI000255D003|nr:PD40 domain-containing protein [Nesterenkonia sp. F]